MRKSKALFSVLSVIFVFTLFRVSSAHDFIKFNDEQKNIGIYLDNWRDLDNFPVTPDIIGWFENWYGQNSFQKLKLCAENKTSVPLITWQPQNISLREIVEGEHDAYILTYLQSITSIAPDMDILIRFAHEMEVRPQYSFSWYSWQAEKKPTLYIEAWRHIVTLSRQVNTNIKWVWSPNRADKYADPFYPGDEYVDYISVTMNLRESDPNYKDYVDFLSFYEDVGVREHLAGYDKKIIISEVGYSNPDIKMRVSYLQSIFDYFKSDWQIAAIIFFDKNSGEDSMFKISDNEELLRVFNDGYNQIANNR